MHRFALSFDPLKLALYLLFIMTMTNPATINANEHIFQHIQDHYSPEELTELTKLYTGAMPDKQEGKVTNATVIGLTDHTVIVDLKAKSNGVIPMTEFRDLPDLKIGDTVEVYVEKQENYEGNLLVSRRSARMLKAWEKLLEAQKSQEALQGRVLRKIKGGLVLDLLGLEVFLPGSQIDIHQTTDFDAYVGKEVMVCVVKINPNKENIIVSRRFLIEREQAEQRKKVISGLEQGQILSGTVRNIMSYGVFIDLGGIVGLLHKKDIAWHAKLDDVSTTKQEDGKPLFELGQQMNVAIKDFDLDKSYISLSTKMLAWAKLPQDIKEGSIVQGTIRQLSLNYALAEIFPGVVGLLHISEMTYNTRIKNVEKLLSLNEKVELEILSIDRGAQELRLGRKQFLSNPWENIEEKYPVGSTQEATVHEMVKYGTYLQLDAETEGFLPNKELSWLKKIHDAKEVLKKGQKVQVMVIHIDQEKRHLELSLRALEDNPWPAFAKVFQKGSTHSGTIIKLRKDGAIIELPNGIHTFVSTLELPPSTKDKPIELNSTWDFKVVECVAAQQKLILAHKDSKRSKEAPSHYGYTDAQASNATLGDLEVLQQLKKELAEKNREEQRSLKPKTKK